MLTASVQPSTIDSSKPSGQLKHNRITDPENLSSMHLWLYQNNYVIFIHINDFTKTKAFKTVVLRTTTTCDASIHGGVNIISRYKIMHESYLNASLWWATGTDPSSKTLLLKLTEALLDECTQGGCMAVLTLGEALPLIQLLCTVEQLSDWVTALFPQTPVTHCWLSPTQGQYRQPAVAYHSPWSQGHTETQIYMQDKHPGLHLHIHIFLYTPLIHAGVWLLSNEFI